MASEMSQAELTRVRDWASRQLADGHEAPWSSFLLKRLGETLDALLAGMAATQAEATPEAARCQAIPRLVVCNAPRDGDRGRSYPSRSRTSDRTKSGEKAELPVVEPVN